MTPYFLKTSESWKEDEYMGVVKSGLLAGVILLYFFDFFLEGKVTGIITVLLFLLLIIVLPKAKAATRIMGIFLIGAGVFINLSMNRSSMIGSIEGIQLNLPLLILILMAPLFSIPLKSGGYINFVTEYIEQVKTNSSKLFLSISGFLSLLAPILNIGSVRIMDDLLKNRNLNPELLGRGYFTGFSTAMVWSPYFGSVALILYYLNIPYSEYFLIGFLFACLQLLTGNILFNKKISRTNTQINKKSKDEQSRKNIFTFVFKFILALVVFIAGLILLESITKMSMLMLVSMLAIVIPAFWMVFLRKWKDFVHQLRIYSTQVRNEMNTEIVLFLSAGIFGAAISQSSILEWIKGVLMGISNFSFIFFVVFIIFIVMFSAFIGLHQIVTVPILLLQIDPALLDIEPIIIAFIFILAWFMSAIFSPFNAITIIISNAVNKKVLTVGVKWNGLYVFSMFLIGSIFIYGLQIIYK